MLTQLSLDMNPLGQAANILKLDGQTETFVCSQGSSSSAKLSATRNHSQHTSASSCYYSSSLRTPWHGTGTVAQKWRRQMAKMSSHILSNPSLTLGQEHMRPNQLPPLLFQSVCLR